MPAAFEDCVKRGGKVRRKTLSEGRYINICFIDGKSYPGEVKKKQTAGLGRAATSKLGNAGQKGYQ